MNEHGMTLAARPIRPELLWRTEALAVPVGRLLTGTAIMCVAVVGRSEVAANVVFVRPHRATGKPVSYRRSENVLESGAASVRSGDDPVFQKVI